MRAGPPDERTAPLASSDDDTDDGDAVTEGTQVGRYTVIGCLGEGGAGRVYAGYDAELDRKVALKILHSALPDDANDAQSGWTQVVREARIVARLNHPNVVVVHETGSFEGRPYIVTELVDGDDLGAWLHKRSEAGQTSWREIVGIFVAAGRGLQAAHEAGVIHGDFKPANVLVGSDSRPRVADFGVARLRSTRDVGRRTDHAHDSNDATVTGSRSNELVGTPYYMAPEQFSAEPAAERSDQYSFCMSMYEAITGAKLYDSPSLTALSVAKLHPIAELPTGKASPPRWLRRILRRGLSVDPQDRFASMAELLGDIQRGLGRRRRIRTWTAVAAVGAIGAAVGNVAQSDDASTQACSGSARHLDGIWDDARRSGVDTAMREAGPKLADSTLPKVHAAVTRYANKWVEGHKEACVASAYSEQSEGDARSRQRCLADRLHAMDAVLHTLETADMQTVIRSVAAVEKLPNIDVCADLTRVASIFEAPPAEHVPDVEQIQRGIRDADATYAVARFAESKEIASDMLGIAERIEHGPSRSLALLRLGKAEYAFANVPEAISHLEAAAKLAVAHGRDELAATAMLYVVHFMAPAPSDGRAVGEAASWAKALVERSGNDPRLQADLAMAEGWGSFKAGQLEPAIEQLELARELHEAREGPDGAAVGMVELRLGEVLRDAGRTAEAKRALEHSLAVKRSVSGPDHPEVGAILNILGTVQADGGDPAGARASMEAALANQRAVYGPEHPGVAMIMSNLSSLLAAGGEYEPAEELLREVLRIMEKTLGPTHPEVGMVLANLASLAVDGARYSEALPLLDRAEQIALAQGEKHPAAAYVLSNRVLALGSLGRWAEAHAAAESMLARAEASVPDGHPLRGAALRRFAWALAGQGRHGQAVEKYNDAIEALEGQEVVSDLAETLAERGRAQLASGNAEAALSDLERAHRLLTPLGGPALADAAFDLARALGALGRQPQRAASLATAASELYRREGRDDLRDEATRWVAAQRHAAAK